MFSMLYQHIALCTAPAGRYCYKLNWQGKRARITCPKYAVSGGTPVWIQKARFRTSAPSRCTMLSLSGWQWFSKSRLHSPSLNSWPTALLALGRLPWKSFLTDLVGRMPGLPPSLFPPLPLREHYMCRIRKWLWKKHVELWCEKNGKGLRLTFFSLQYTVQNLNFSVEYHYSTFSVLTQKCLDLFNLGSKLCQKRSLSTWRQGIKPSSVEKNLRSCWRDFNPIEELRYVYVNRKPRK